MNKFIDKIIRRIEQWELQRLQPIVDQLDNEVAKLDETARCRLEEFDREAKLYRDDFKAVIQIDGIRASRKLADKQHRLAVLKRSLGVQS